MSNVQRAKAKPWQVAVGCCSMVVLAMVACSMLPDCAERASAPAVVAKTGDAVAVGYTTYTVHSSRWGSRLAPGNFMDRAPNAKFLFVDVSVRNDDKEARMVPPFKLIDEAGSTYESDSTGAMLPGAFGALTNLNPKVTQRGFVVFDVPPQHTYQLLADGGYWSKDSARIQLQPTAE